MVLLEKQLPFTEKQVPPGSKDETMLASSPLGKVPFVRTEYGTMLERQAGHCRLNRGAPARASAGLRCHRRPFRPV
jgi:glutathione S-transferase